MKQYLDKDTHDSALELNLFFGVNWLRYKNLMFMFPWLYNMKNCYPTSSFRIDSNINKEPHDHRKIIFNFFYRIFFYRAHLLIYCFTCLLVYYSMCVRKFLSVLIFSILFIFPSPIKNYSLGMSDMRLKFKRKKNLKRQNSLLRESVFEWCTQWRHEYELNQPKCQYSHIVSCVRYNCL